MAITRLSFSQIWAMNERQSNTDHPVTNNSTRGFAVSARTVKFRAFDSNLEDPYNGVTFTHRWRLCRLAVHKGFLALKLQSDCREHGPAGSERGGAGPRGGLSMCAFTLPAVA